MTNEEFKKISSTEVAKEAWTILETTYEGTKVVKTVKFQRLTSSFKEVRMEEDETFDEFYAKLKDIVNSAFNLGESIVESKIVRKILKSLPKRFHAKITFIEEEKEINQIPLTELIGNLQIYEMGLGSMGKCGKSKNLALKGIAEKIEDSSDDEVPKKLTLQEAYDKLCTEFIKSEKTSHLCRKELNEVKLKKLIY